MEYLEKYGDIPFTKKDILKYIEENFKLNMNNIENARDHINLLQWKEIELILYLLPRPSARPRYSFKTSHFYVPGAGAGKKLMKKRIKESNIIYTRVEYILETYQPQPISSMNNTEIYLAEEGLLRPIQNPDWDNLGKTYSDMLIDVLLLNDNIITSGRVEKYFSLKPRVRIILRYQDDFDSRYNKKKITSSTSYIKAKNQGLIYDRKE